MKFKSTRELVYYLLENYPKLRDSDNLLFIKVIESKYPGLTNRPFSEVLMNLEPLHLPQFETVRRTRQDIQEHNPRLMACDEVQDFRTEKEMAFRKEFGK